MLRPRGKKSSTRIETEYLDWALADFSGYLAADALYDGTFCVLSAVDARRQRRLLYEVLYHDPTRADIVWFLARLDDLIRARGHAVRGITTDASPLYPQPIAVVLDGVPHHHQVSAFHILKELTQAVPRVLARLRKRLATQAPQVLSDGTAQERFFRDAPRPVKDDAAPKRAAQAWLRLAEERHQGGFFQFTIPDTDLGVTGAARVRQGAGGAAGEGAGCLAHQQPGAPPADPVRSRGRRHRRPGGAPSAAPRGTLPTFEGAAG
jgi:hypothetical protein